MLQNNICSSGNNLPLTAQLPSATAHNTSKTFKMLLTMCISIMLAWQSKAQFAAPVLPQTYYPTPVTSTDYLNNVHTKYISNYSSDLSNWSIASGKGIDVTGWTFNESVGGGGKIIAGTHSISFASAPFVGEVSVDVPDAVDLRVGYMGDFIVAAYFNATTKNYMFSWWNWPGPPATTVTYIGSYILPIAPGSPSIAYERISMDINLDMDEAAIVYSDRGTIYGAAISLIGATFTPSVSIGTGPYPLSSLIGPSSGNINPDVSFNRDPISGNDFVYYTYYNTGLGQEAVFSIPYAPDFTGSITTGATWAFFGSETLPIGVNYVNFDCPDHFSFNHWAYTYSDGNKVYLRADTANGAGTAGRYTTIINDGTLTGLPTDISLVTNLAPTLTYKHELGRDEIFVVWASLVLSAFSTGYNNNYIGATVAVNGALAPRAVSSPDYAIIDNDPNSFYVTGQPLIALDRKVQKGNRFVSFGTDNSSKGYEMKHKNVEFFNDYYRRSDPNSPTTISYTQDNLKLYPNPFANAISMQIPAYLQKDIWSIRISDLLGRQIDSYNGTAPSNFVQEASRKLSTGQYIIKLQSNSTNPQVVKITKQ